MVRVRPRYELVFVFVTLTPSQKGAIADTAITAAATELGVSVLRPVNEGVRYDLVFDLHPRLLRVQCKWAPRRDQIVQLNARTCRYGPSGRYIRTHYSGDEVDALAGYCPELRRCYLVPISVVAGRSMLHLRLAPARNNQKQLTHVADDYDLAKMVDQLGAVAQLGERRRGTPKARGSSPLSSTDEEAAQPRGLFAV